MHVASSTMSTQTYCDHDSKFHVAVGMFLHIETHMQGEDTGTKLE